MNGKNIATEVLFYLIKHKHTKRHRRRHTQIIDKNLNTIPHHSTQSIDNICMDIKMLSNMLYAIDCTPTRPSKKPQKRTTLSIKASACSYIIINIKEIPKTDKHKEIIHSHKRRRSYLHADRKANRMRFNKFRFSFLNCKKASGDKGSEFTLDHVTVTV